MDLDPQLVAYIISVALAFLSAHLGNKYTKYKQMATKISSALKATSDAIKDDRITPDEEKIVVEQWENVIDSAKNILK